LQTLWQHVVSGVSLLGADGVTAYERVAGETAAAWRRWRAYLPVRSGMARGMDIAASRISASAPPRRCRAVYRLPCAGGSIICVARADIAAPAAPLNMAAPSMFTVAAAKAALSCLAGILCTTRRGCYLRRTQSPSLTEEKGLGAVRCANKRLAEPASSA